MATDMRIRWHMPDDPDKETRRGVEALLRRPPLLLTGETETRRYVWLDVTFEVTWIRSDHGPYNAYVKAVGSNWRERLN